MWSLGEKEFGVWYKVYESLVFSDVVFVDDLDDDDAVECANRSCVAHDFFEEEMGDLCCLHYSPPQIVLPFGDPQRTP